MKKVFITFIFLSVLCDIFKIFLQKNFHRQLKNKLITLFFYYNLLEKIDQNNYDSTGRSRNVSAELDCNQLIQNVLSLESVDQNLK